jgi:hypothetical protein
MTLPPWLDNELHAAMWLYERDRRDRLLELQLEAALESLRRPAPDSLCYGVSPEIDQLIDDEWAAHDARLRRGD